MLQQPFLNVREVKHLLFIYMNCTCTHMLFKVYAWRIYIKNLLLLHALWKPFIIIKHWTHSLLRMLALQSYTSKPVIQVSCMLISMATGLYTLAMKTPKSKVIPLFCFLSNWHNEKRGLNLLWLALHSKIYLNDKMPTISKLIK